MTPEEILHVSFTSAGKGGYSAAEVTAYLTKLSSEFSAMQKNNEELKRRMARMLETIKQYDKEKEHIYKTMVAAEAMAESTLGEAKVQSESILTQAATQAQQLLGEKRAEADAYYYEKTHAAEEKLSSLEIQIKELEEKFSHCREEYVRLAEEKANEIVQKANDDAAAIVAAAYDDAKKTRAQADKVVAETSAKLGEFETKVKLFKNQITSAVESITPAMNAIEVDSEFTAENTQVNVTSQSVDPLPKFSFNITEEVRSVPVWQDISSNFAGGVALADEDTEPEDVNSYSKPEGDIFGEKTVDFFDGSDDVIPSDFIYDSGYTSLADTDIEEDIDGEE